MIFLKLAAISLSLLFSIVLVFFAPIKQGGMEFLPYFIFSISFVLIILCGLLTSKSLRINISENSLDNLSPCLTFIASLFCLMASVYGVKFYTGLSIDGVFVAVFSGGSNYNEYQSYVLEKDLGIFSFNKLPAIFSLAYVKLCLLFAFYRFYMRKFDVLSISSCAIIVFSQVYISIGRGTSFEILEILLLSLFVFFLNVRKGSYSIKSVLFVILLIVTSVIYYTLSIDARFDGNYTPLSLNELTYSKDDGVDSILLFQLSNYFLHGPLYFSHFFEELSNESYFLGALFPFFDLFFELDSRYYCTVNFNCDNSWVSSNITHILKLGLVGFWIYLYYCSRLFSSMVESLVLRSNMIFFVLSYYLFLNFFSLPIGDFIWVSSANIINVVFFGGIGIYHLIIRRNFVK